MINLFFALSFYFHCRDPMFSRTLGNSYGIVILLLFHDDIQFRFPHSIFYCHSIFHCQDPQFLRGVGIPDRFLILFSVILFFASGL